jgi:hypothetical protein
MALLTQKAAEIFQTATAEHLASIGLIAADQVARGTGLARRLT